VAGSLSVQPAGVIRQRARKRHFFIDFVDLNVDASVDLNVDARSPPSFCTIVIDNDGGVR
jgi:hypothetical protein